MTLFVKQASAVTSTARAKAGSITIPNGQSGRVIEIQALVFGVDTTVVNAGGKVELENDSADWKPCDFVLGGFTAVTEGGCAYIKPLKIPVDLKLPAPSIIDIWYTPFNALEQALQIALIWETGNPDTMKPRLNRANHMKSDVGTAITQITVDKEHNEIKIPSEKGGRLLGVEFTPLGTLETVVCSGGKVDLLNTVEAWKPFEFIIGGMTTVGASGGGIIEPQRHRCDKRLAGNSIVHSDFIPYDNQSQLLGLTIMWRGKEPVLA